MTSTYTIESTSSYQWLGEYNGGTHNIWNFIQPPDISQKFHFSWIVPWIGGVVTLLLLNQARKTWTPIILFLSCQALEMFFRDYGGRGRKRTVEESRLPNGLGPWIMKTLAVRQAIPRHSFPCLVPTPCQNLRVGLKCYAGVLVQYRIVRRESRPTQSQRCIGFM